jgi:hypothetical protein
MAGKLGIGIGLGIDFAALDSDLQKVAARIEAVGKKPVKLSADIATGGADAGKIADAVGQLGARLSSGMSAGTQQAMSMMTGFAAHINKMMDRVSGATIEMFRRIDSAMKFPAFFNFFKSAQVRLSNFTSLVRKPMSVLDLAISGGFGSMLSRVASLIKEIVAQITSAITGALKSSVSELVAEFAKLAPNAAKTVPILDDMATLADRVDSKIKNLSQSAALPLRSQVAGVGRRIGFGTDFTAQPSGRPAASSRPRMDMFTAMKTEGPAVLKAIGDKLMLVTSLTAKFGAAMVSVPLRVINPLMKLHNFLGSIGDVGKSSFRKLYESQNIFVRALMAPIKLTANLAKGLLHIGTLGVFRKQAAEAGMAASAIGNAGNAAKSFGRDVMVALGAFGLAFKAVQFIKDGIMGASALNETVNRTKVVFGEAFGPVEAQANAMSNAFRVSRQSQMDVAAGFGAMAQGAGMSEKASADLANRMTAVAANLTSSVNAPFEETSGKIRSALAGQSEPLREFGVLMTEDSVKAKAMAMGLGQAKGAISEQAKMMARAQLVVEGLAYAENDLANTADSTANQFRKAGGGLTEFATRIGEVLLPAVNLGAQAFNEFMAITLEVFEGSLPVIQNWASYLTTAMSAVGMLVRNFGAFFQIAKLRIGEFAANAVAWVGVLPANFAQYFEHIKKNWWLMLLDMVAALGTFGQNLYTNVTNLMTAVWKAFKGEEFDFKFTPLLDGFRSTAEALPNIIKPELISVQDEVDRIMKEIQQKEADRAASLPAFGKGKKPPGSAMEPGKESEYKLASAVEISSKEAYSVLAKSGVSGRTTAGAIRDGNKIAADAAATLKRIEAKTGKQPELAVR